MYDDHVQGLHHVSIVHSLGGNMDLSETENPKDNLPSRWFGDTGYHARTILKTLSDRWIKI